MIKKITIKSTLVFLLALFFAEAVVVLAQSNIPLTDDVSRAIGTEDEDVVSAPMGPGGRMRGGETREGRMITVEGEMTCLPHRDTSGGVTMECAFGLRGRNGNHYSLNNLNQDDFVSGRLRAGQMVRVMGMFVPDLSGPYDIAGVVDVHSLVYIGDAQRENQLPDMPNGEADFPGGPINSAVFEKRAQFQQRMQQHRDELRLRAAETKQRVKEQREELRTQWEERKAQLSERRKHAIQSHIERISRRMRSAIERLDKISNKLTDRIAVMRDSGVDVTDMAASLEDARSAVARAELLLQGAVEHLRAAPDMENPADAIGAARLEFEDVKAAIREAHAALVEITTSLKGRSSMTPAAESGVETGEQ